MVIATSLHAVGVIRSVTGVSLRKVQKRSAEESEKLRDMADEMY
jgi:hypothetical protein